MMNQNLIKGLAVAAIWCSSTLVLQAAQDNIAPRAHVTVSNVLKIMLPTTWLTVK